MTNFNTLSNTDTTHTSAAVKGNQLHCLNIPDYCMWPDDVKHSAHISASETQTLETLYWNAMNNLCCLVDAKRKQAGKDKGMIEEHNQKLCMWFEPSLWDAVCSVCGSTCPFLRPQIVLKWEYRQRRTEILYVRAHSFTPRLDTHEWTDRRP